MHVLAYASAWLCRYVSMCGVCMHTPPSLSSSSLLCLCASVQGGVRGADRFQQALSRKLAPLSPTLHFTSQAAVGAELLAAGVHPPPSLGGRLTLGYPRDMCERSSYFYPALTGCDGSVEEGLSAFQGY